jgi:hypothetical protein
MRDADDDWQPAASPSGDHVPCLRSCDLRMFKIADCKVEPRQREDLYHFAPPELYECAENGARVHPVSKLHSVACHGIQNESYCTAKQVLDGLSEKCGSGAVWLPRVGFEYELRDERLPEGPRFASEPLDADTGRGQFFKLPRLPALTSRESLTKIFVS